MPLKTPQLSARLGKHSFSGEKIRFIPLYRFKRINKQENIWSVRLTRGYRALGVLEDDSITWFWIGNHDDYRRSFGS
jgi:hypothetical protein